jgi:hypothetical protein
MCFVPIVSPFLGILTADCSFIGSRRSRLFSPRFGKKGRPFYETFKEKIRVFIRDKLGLFLTKKFEIF